MAYGNEKFDKRWEIRSIQVAQPAAGAEWSTTVPAGQVWKVKAILCQFVASSTVASRNVSIVMTDGTNLLVGAAVAGTYAASSNIYFSGFPGTVQQSASLGNSFGGHGLQTFPIPEIVLPAGSTIGSSTLALQTGDQWQAISLLIESADAF